MRSFASDVSEVDHERLGKLSLNSETPLLSIRPDRFRRNRGDVKRISGASWRYRATDARSGTIGVSAKRRPISVIADARVTKRKRLRNAEHQRRARLERTGVGFVTRAMLKKNAIAAADRRLTVAPRVPRKPNPRRRVEQVPLHAACGRAAGTRSEEH